MLAYEVNAPEKKSWIIIDGRLSIFFDPYYIHERIKMHNHNVYFWLKEGLSDSALLEFEKGLESLTKTALVVKGYYGKPANTNRPVVDRTYSYGLSLLFNDTDDQNLYQADLTHLAFVDKNEKKWTKAVVFDLQTQ
jgi:hypothetical protein